MGFFSEMGLSEPFMELQDEMNQLFQDFMGSSSSRREDVGPGSRFLPQVDVSESAESVRITMDTPGMDEDDIELTVSDHTLMITGERKMEEERNGENYYHRERGYGMFRRSIPLPEGIDVAKIEARYKRGVLTVDLPKNNESRKNWRRIKVKSD